MAGASMNDIKARMKSVESTMQITKAMELVATSKLRRAKERAEATRPYLSAVGRIIDGIRSSSELSDSAYFSKKEGAPHLFVVIAGDRGLAGGYNSNVLKLAEQLSRGKDATFLPLGKKAYEYLKHRNRPLFIDECTFSAEIGVGYCLDIGEKICQGFLDGAISAVTVVYTEFTSMMTQTPKGADFLPLDQKEGGGDPIVCGDPEELLTAALPSYVGSSIYCAICESVASESGARRTAMNAANKNAEEMIGSLKLTYNRARQAVITQEITEIVSGAEAL